MRFFYGFIAGVAFLMMSAALLSSGAAAQAASSGGVYVATLPSGADVWIDGTYCGRSPVLLDALVEGRHTLTLTKAGWNVQEAQVDIPGGGITLWSAKLQAGPWKQDVPEKGRISVRGLSHTLKVSLDGAPPRVLEHGVAVLPTGPHTIAFPSAHGNVTRAFTVLPDMTSELVLHEEREVRTSGVGVIAPAIDYLPPEAIVIHGRQLTVRYQGHEVLATLDQSHLRLDGAPMSYDSAPSLINGKLYLPLDLLETLTK